MSSDSSERKARLSGCVSSASHWITRDYLGKRITFCLLDRDEETAICASDYLNDAICTAAPALLAQGKLLSAAAKVYAAIPVRVQLAQSVSGVDEMTTTQISSHLADCEDDNNDDMDELGDVVDLWTPLYLALVLQHRESFDVLMRFHASQAYHVAQLLCVRDNQKQQQSIPMSETNSRNRTSVSLSLQNSWGGAAMLLLLRQRSWQKAEQLAGNTVEDVSDASLTREDVLGALSPLLAHILSLACTGNQVDDRHAPSHETKGTGVESADVVRTWLHTLRRRRRDANADNNHDCPNVYHTEKGNNGKKNTNSSALLCRVRTSSPPVRLLLDAEVLFELCVDAVQSGTSKRARDVDESPASAVFVTPLLLLRRVLRTLRGSLIPVFHGEEAMHRTSSSSKEEKNAVGQAETTGVALDNCHVSYCDGYQDVKSCLCAGVEACWIRCAPQEAMRVAFYALWLGDGMRYSHALCSATSISSSSSSSSSYACSVQQCLRAQCEPNTECVLPSCPRLWSTHLTLTAWLLSCACSLSMWSDVMPCSTFGHTQGLQLWTARATATRSRESEHCRAFGDANVMEEGVPAGAVMLYAAGSLMSSLLYAWIEDSISNTTDCSHSGDDDDDDDDIDGTNCSAKEPRSIPSTNSSSYVLPHDLLQRKVAILLSSGTTAHSPEQHKQMDRYFTSTPATHAERFSRMWLCSTAELPTTMRSTTQTESDGATDTRATRFTQNNGVTATLQGTGGGSVVKFDSRQDVLYYAVVEIVLRAAEWAWYANHVNIQHRGLHYSNNTTTRSTDDRVTKEGSLSLLANDSTDHLCAALTAWVSMCNAVLDRLDSSKCVDECNTLETTDRAELAARLRTRLQCGEQPLPRVYDALYCKHEDVSVYESDERSRKAISDSTCTRFAHDEMKKNKNDSHAAVQSNFDAARRRFVACVGQCSDEMKLRCYGLFKQATEGDVRTSAPWRIDVVGRAKWEAWKGYAGMSSVAAKQAYIDICASLT